MLKAKPVETVESFANRIQMRRLRDEEDVLVVEGSLDEMLYSSYVCNTCKISRGGGKDKIIAAMGKLAARGFHNAVAIVDADFDHVDGKVYGNSVYLTDTHDIETMMCERVLEYALKAKCEKIKVVKKLIPAICDLSKWIGVCRYMYKFAYRDNFGNCLDFRRFVSFANNVPVLNTKCFFNQLELFNRPIGKPERKRIIASVSSRAAEISSNEVWQFSQGHDLFKIIAVVLTHLGLTTSEEEISELLLRLYNSEEAFVETNVYKNISSSRCSIWAN